MSGVHCSFNSARHMDGCVVHLVSPLKHIQFTVYMKFQLVFLLSDEQRRIASSFRLIALAHSKRIECFCSRWSTTSSFQLNKRTNELFTSLLPPSHTATYSTLQRKILWWRSQFSLLPSCLLLLKWIIYSFNYEHFFHLWTSLFDSRTAFEWIKIDDYRRFQLSQCEWHLCVSHRCLLRSLTVYYRWFFIVLLWFGWPMHDPDCWLATT